MMDNRDSDPEGISLFHKHAREMGKDELHLTKIKHISDKTLSTHSDSWTPTISKAVQSGKKKRKHLDETSGTNSETLSPKKKKKKKLKGFVSSEIDISCTSDEEKRESRTPVVKNTGYLGMQDACSDEKTKLKRKKRKHELGDEQNKPCGKPSQTRQEQTGGINRSKSLTEEKEKDSFRFQRVEDTAGVGKKRTMVSENKLSCRKKQQPESCELEGSGSSEEDSEGEDGEEDQDQSTGDANSSEEDSTGEDGDEDQDQSTGDANSSEKDQQEEKEEMDEYAQIKQELSTMSFEDLQRLQEKLGMKVFNQIRHGGKMQKKKKQMLFKRENKNRPTEISSKRPVGIIRDTVHAKKKVHRDPRFDDLSGEYNEKYFKKSYAFLEDVKVREKQKVEKTLRKEKDPNKKKDLQYLLNRMSQQESSSRQKERQAAMDKELKQREKQLVREGKTPYFLKKADKKKLELAEKFKELKKSGKVEKYLMKKRKKNAQKDRKKLPGRFDRVDI